MDSAPTNSIENAQPKQAETTPKPNTPTASPANIADRLDILRRLKNRITSRFKREKVFTNIYEPAGSLDDQLDYYQRAMKVSDSNGKSFSLRMVASKSYGASKEDAKKIADFLLNYKNDIANTLTSEFAEVRTDGFIAYEALANYEAKQKSKNTTKVADDLETRVFSGLYNVDRPDIRRSISIADFAVNAIKSNYPAVQEAGAKNTTLVLEKYGLDYDAFLKKWERTAYHTGSDPNQPEPDPYLYLGQNLKNIVLLEERQPGICTFLNQEFGIVNFGRFPHQMLLEQYQQANNSDTPYGVVLYPAEDYNGAFYHDKDAFLSLNKQLRGKYLVRFGEAESKYDIGRKLIDLRKRYGKQKISFAVIGGHGTETSIEFGGDDPKHILKAEDLKGRGVGRTSEFFEPHPTIVLVSCSTGAKNGIAQQMSETIGANVVAPAGETNIKDFKVSFTNDDRLILDAQYRDSKDESTMVYNSGALIATRGKKDWEREDANRKLLESLREEKKTATGKRLKSQHPHRLN
ncbi:MAG TPA: hypothetical protein VLE91_04170 [Candidatus Saccharimonadales bacterium]|nr:hypothetical protein [Candidatus Saccharimonadales bacterium]